MIWTIGQVLGAKSLVSRDQHGQSKDNEGGREGRGGGRMKTEESGTEGNHRPLMGRRQRAGLFSRSGAEMMMPARELNYTQTTS